MSDVLDLASELIRRRSVTPDDAGCQALIAARLQRAGLRMRAPALRRSGQPLGHAWQRPARAGVARAIPTWCLPGPARGLGQRSLRADDPRRRAVRAWRGGHEGQRRGLRGRAGAVRRRAPAIIAGTVALLLTSDEEGDAIDGVRRVADAFRERGRPSTGASPASLRPRSRLGDLLRVGRRGTPVGDADGEGHPGPRRLSGQGAQSDPPGAAGAGRTGRATLGRGLRNLPADQPAGYQLPRRHRRQQRDSRRAEGAVQPALQPALGCSAAGSRDRRRAATGMAWNTTCTGIAAASRSIRPKAGCARWRAKCWPNSPARRRRKAPAGGTSDARFIAPLGAQCIEIGPVNASIHKVDENVSVAELEALPALYLRP